MQEPRRLATVNGYQGIIAACKARKEELGISDAEFEEMAGLTRGHWHKITSYNKILGPLSMGPVLRNLGIKIAIQEDEPEHVAELRARYTHRAENQVRKPPMLAKASRSYFPYLFDSKKGREMAAKRTAALSPARRKAIAKKAARARQQKRIQYAKLASTP